jgi:hypothetical protein
MQICPRPDNWAARASSLRGRMGPRSCPNPLRFWNIVKGWVLEPWLMSAWLVTPKLLPEWASALHSSTDPAHASKGVLRRQAPVERQHHAAGRATGIRLGRGATAGASQRSSGGPSPHRSAGRGRSAWGAGCGRAAERGCAGKDVRGGDAGRDPSLSPACRRTGAGGGGGEP